MEKQKKYKGGNGARERKKRAKSTKKRRGRVGKSRDKKQDKSKACSSFVFIIVLFSPSYLVRCPFHLSFLLPYLLSPLSSSVIFFPLILLSRPPVHFGLVDFFARITGSLMSPAYATTFFSLLPYPHLYSLLFLTYYNNITILSLFLITVIIPFTHLI